MTKHIHIIILSICFCLCSKASIAQVLKVEDKGKDNFSVSTKMSSDGTTPSARVIVESPLKLDYKSNMGDLTYKDIVRGTKNGLKIDTLYFYITNENCTRRVTISAYGYSSEVLSFRFKPKETYKYVIFDPNKGLSSNSTRTTTTYTAPKKVITIPTTTTPRPVVVQPTSTPVFSTKVISSDIHKDKTILPTKVIKCEVFTKQVYLDMGSPTNCVIPDGCEEIAASAFVNTNISSVKIPSSVKKIGDSAFFGCSQLREASLPKATRKLGSNVFDKCVNLKKLTINAMYISGGKNIVGAKNNQNTVIYVPLFTGGTGSEYSTVSKLRKVYGVGYVQYIRK